VTPRAVPRWQVRRSGVSHVVEICPPSGWQGGPKSFRCDEVEYPLKYGFGPRTRTISFQIARSPASLTYGHRQTKFFWHLARRIFKLLRDPLMWLAYAFGGPGAGGGAVGELSPSFNILWIHEMSVAGGVGAPGPWIRGAASDGPLCVRARRSRTRTCHADPIRVDARLARARFVVRMMVGATGFEPATSRRYWSSGRGGGLGSGCLHKAQAAPASRRLAASRMRPSGR
jgi:hypothetical protein